MSFIRFALLAVAVTLPGAASAQGVPELDYERLTSCSAIYVGAAGFHDRAGRTQEAEVARSKASTLDMLMGATMLRQSAPATSAEWSRISKQINQSLEEFRGQVEVRLGIDKELPIEQVTQLFEEWLPYCDGQLPMAETRLLQEVAWQTRLAGTIAAGGR
ncbi:hypothetical protein [Tranquillimonas alkanivorans]|uniref:Uncharacterized protein n=1 Tax=Tranquillimonas alkanivorans TaxID=441119 RepID=A0A1I5WFA8_9RHOB|nr:hypothetical protein [Tranquillimonas alkanivorans]SFQ18259.1 hypothetical protein SAMN04488047_1455 [Tranquillimonas alkanivorans]